MLHYQVVSFVSIRQDVKSAIWSSSLQQFISVTWQRPYGDA